MKALTFWDPYGSGVVFGTKRIENRPWRPPAAMMGQRFCIHVGKTYDREAERVLRLEGLFPPELGPRGSIIGVATVVDVVTESDDPWFMGPFGWVLEDVHPLRRYLPVRGFQKFWTVPAEFASRLEVDYAPGNIADGRIECMEESCREVATHSLFFGELERRLCQTHYSIQRG